MFVRRYAYDQVVLIHAAGQVAVEQIANAAEHLFFNKGRPF